MNLAPTSVAAAPMSAEKIANYESERGAVAYKADHQNKLHRRWSTRREHAIFARLLRSMPRRQVILDLPCGAGRLFPLLSRYADQVIEADWSGSMVRLNRQDHRAAARGYMRCNALAVPLPDRSVDLAVSVRLSHHLERVEDRELHLREMFRIARHDVIVSFFSHTSFKNWLRRLRAPFDRKRPKNTLHTRQARTVAEAAGFHLVQVIPLSRVASGHVFARFTRLPQTDAR